MAILFNKKLDFTVHNVISDENSPDGGHYLILYLTIQGKKWLIGCLYAPNRDDVSFFQKVFHEVERFSPEHKVIGGDFNLGLDTSLDRLGTGGNKETSAKWLRSYLKVNEWIDS